VSSQLTVGAFGTQRWVNEVQAGSEQNRVKIIHHRLQRGGFRENSAYHREGLALLGTLQSGRNLETGFLFNYTYLKAFIPSSIGRMLFENNPEAAASNWKAARGYEQYDQARFGLSLDYRPSTKFSAENAIFTSFRWADEPRPFNILREQTVGMGSRHLFTFLPDQRWEIRMGGEWFRDFYQWETFENNYTTASNGSVLGDILSMNQEVRSFWNLFAQIDHQIFQSLDIQAGVNLNNTKYRYQDLFLGDGDESGNYWYEPILSPRVALLYQFEAEKSAFVQLSHGFSPPSLEETLYPDGTINAEIQPETGWNYEVGTRGSLNRSLFYDFSFYFMDIENLLVAQRIGPDAFIGVNAGGTNHMGLEGSMNYTFWSQIDRLVNGFFNFSYMDYQFEEFVNEGVDYQGNQLTGTSPWQINAGIELLSDRGFYGNLNWNYRGAAPLNDGNTLFSDPFQTLNLKAGHRWDWSTFELDLSGGVNNLLDQDYASMLLINATGFGGNEPRYFYPGNPRNFFISLKLSYRKE
jgi:iron complex outermembrane receptor protein